MADSEGWNEVESLWKGKLSGKLQKPGEDVNGRHLRSDDGGAETWLGPFRRTDP